MRALGSERGPLVLGAGGRVGRMWRHLAAQGLWPGPEPLWHARDGREGSWAWDMGREPPPLPATLPAPVRGVVALARPPKGWGEEGPATLALARAALDLAEARGLGPVLLLSSGAVYGRGDGPRGEEDASPADAYGRAKLAMEAEVAGRGACCLRLGNVAGADALFDAMAEGPVTLDRLAEGTAPRRAYVGPLALAHAMLALLALPSLPAVLNLAQPGLVAMDDLLRAAGQTFEWRPAPPSALPALEMDLSRLLALVPLPPATPEGLVAEARLAGWRPWGKAA